MCLLRAATEQPQTVVYKTAQDCEIKADVFGSPAQGRKPVAVWIHGGALIGGSRKLAANARILRSLLDVGFVVVSIDYRSRLPKRSYRQSSKMCRMRVAGSVPTQPPYTLIRDRLAVCGGSAGGYLTLMTGFCVNPRPKALVPYWGYGDIVGAWYSQPRSILFAAAGSYACRGFGGRRTCCCFGTPDPTIVVENSIYTVASRVCGRKRLRDMIPVLRTAGSLVWPDLQRN